ncbi:MAG TPA: NADH-quinone oxidoreductase subunit M [Saprospiraceae bacterium]|nr:NADH-quinone oxidoreductase subunit M [Saprospiraceae bacterium]HND88370.1 NADH-quinone oxidoreductase subunit M [Saprospiraceae bacterium]
MSLLFILIPFIASLALLLLRPGRGASQQLALLAALANLVATAYCLTCDYSQGITCAFDMPWVADAGIRFSLGMDGITLLMLLLTNLLAPLIVLSSWSRAFDSEARYYGLVMMMLGALNGVFLAQDGLLFYVFYELALIPIYFICAIWGGENRIRITLKFFIYTFVGSLFMLLSLLWVYLQTDVNGLHSFAWADMTRVHLPDGVANWVILGFFLAFAVKMPVFPFHTWQPDTYVAAPTGGTMLLSGIMLKMGIYGVIRWMVPLAPGAMHNLAPIFMVLAITGIVYASLIAVKQSDLKRLIAYSSIAHVGLIAAGVLAWNKAGLQGSMIQMLNHGINVVGLFLVGDLIERRLGTRSLADMGGIAKSAPKFAALFMIIMLGSVAVPLTNGFPGEFLLLNGVWHYNFWMGAVAGLTIIFGAVYMLRAYGLVMFGEANRDTAQFADVSGRDQLVLGVIAALVLVLGFFPGWVLSLTDSSVSRILGAVQL